MAERSDFPVQFVGKEPEIMTSLLASLLYIADLGTEVQAYSEGIIYWPQVRTWS